MGVDIAFSDHRMARETLEEFGSVVAAISRASDDAELRFWTFIEFVAKNHPDVLAVKLEPAMQSRVDSLKAGLQLPAVTVRPGNRAIAPDDAKEHPADSRLKHWWQFWK